MKSAWLDAEGVAQSIGLKRRAAGGEPKGHLHAVSDLLAQGAAGTLKPAAEMRTSVLGGDTTGVVCVGSD